VVLKQEDCVRALRAAHSRFYLSKTTLAMGIIGPGLIGGTLLDQLKDQVCEMLDYSSMYVVISLSNSMQFLELYFRSKTSQYLYICLLIIFSLFVLSSFSSQKKENDYPFTAWMNIYIANYLFISKE